MSQLGFTFYPKDWWTSDSFFLLQPFERYIYLECLFMMYSNDGFISSNKMIVERRLGTTIKDEVWNKIADLMVKDNDQLTHKSVNKRLRKTLANRENGKKGGRPKDSENKSNKENEKPKKPKKETQKNPPLEKEREYKENIKENISVSLSPNGSTPTKSFKQFSKTDFTNEIQPFLQEFGKELCNQFFSYWTEKSASGKMKFQLEKTWDTKRRLDTWRRNEDKFGSKQPKEVPTNRVKEKEL